MDALVELGRYDEAEQALEPMLDLPPGPDAYARASYLAELRGDGDRAQAAMQAAHDDAATDAERGFASY